MPRLTITCEECGFKHKVARSIDTPQVVRIICHDCEAPLGASVTAWDIANARPDMSIRPIRETPPTAG
jgi:RNase P subunit RPR2